MPQPTLHPKTGTYQFRRRVPADVLRLLGGPPVVKASLGTKGLREAKRRFIAMAAEVDARWDMLRKSVQNLDDEQVEALGGEVYRDILARVGEDRGPWLADAYGGLRAMGEMVELSYDTRSHSLIEVNLAQDPTSRAGRSTRSRCVVSATTRRSASSDSA